MRAVLVLGLGVWLGAGCATPASAVDSSNRFGFDLYARAKIDDGDRNRICSPFSAEAALAMASGGARGRTRAEMVRVLHLDDAKMEETHASFGALLAALNGRNGADGVELHVADQLWGQAGFAFEASFKDLLRHAYGAPLAEVDFAHATEAARAAINKWAATETKGRITEILNDGDVDTSTRFVLTNAIYFKGRWAQPFAPAMTRARDFATARGPVPTPMMSQVGTIAHARFGDLQLVELPYKGGLSMVVVLPDRPDGLAAAERAAAGSYDKWVTGLRPALVDLELPRWKMTSRLDLNRNLSELGMSTAFSRAADLSGIGPGQLQITRVIQEAFIEVDEVGTEATAVTAVVVGDESEELNEPKPIVFHADHPFFYFIRDVKTGAVLFMGRLVEPQGS